MKMQSAVEEYLVEIEVRKYTPKTIRSYRCNLNLFLSFYAAENCDLKDINMDVRVNRTSILADWIAVKSLT